jgi:hypothetical protein
MVSVHTVYRRKYLICSDDLKVAASHAARVLPKSLTGPKNQNTLFCPPAAPEWFLPWDLCLG